MTDDKVVTLLQGMRDDMERHHAENKERDQRIEAKQEKFEDALKEMSQAIATLANSMVRFLLGHLQTSPA